LRKFTRPLLFSLFAISGFAGLIYESLWTHYLKLFLGHAAYAQALVLAIFMGGMAIGSWISSRWSSRWRNLLLAYAWTELLIGLLALVFHEAFVAATGYAYLWIIPRLAGAATALLVFKWLLASFLILPQSILLGMTFPLMTAGALRAFPDRPGRTLAMFYFTNSLGAAAGVLVSGFVLLRTLGLPGTARFAGVLNLVVGLAVWWMCRGLERPEEVASRSGARPHLFERGFFGILLVSLVTGASSFMYEVGWIRMLSLVLGASTHAFELMLSAFILGLALGGLWVTRRIDGMASPVRVLGIIQVAMGLLALATLVVYGRSFEAMRWLVTTLPRTVDGYGLFNLASNGIAMAIMLPATICAGMTLPLITFHLLQKGYGESSIGSVYAANTLGAIVAVFFSIHAGFPLLGLKGLVTLGASLDIGLGIALLLLKAAGYRRKLVPGAFALTGVLAVALTLFVVELDPYKMAAGVYRNGRLLDPGTETVGFHRDGKTATISVINNRVSGITRISTNGKIDAAIAVPPGRAATFDESLMILAGLIPMSLHPDAKTAAVIGFGSGLTTHTLLSNPRLESVDTIEIEENVIEGAKLFLPRNSLAYGDPRSHVHVDDARTFLSAHGGRYDLIVSQPSDPWVSGVASLFTREFYQHLRRHLKDDGLLVQWLQLYDTTPELVASVLKALEAEFSDYVIYAPNDENAIVIARNGGSVGELDDWVFQTPDLSIAARRVGIATLQDLERRKIGSRTSLSGFTDSFSIPLNSDFFPVLDQRADLSRYLATGAQQLLYFQRSPLPVLEMFSRAGPARPETDVREARFFTGTQRAHRAMLLRDYVLRARQPQAPTSPSLEDFPEAAPLASWAATCARAPVGPFPLQGFLFVAQSTVNELSADELHRMWEPLTAACRSRIGTAGLAWVDFVLALSARDAKAMISTSQGLLDGTPGLALMTRRYLVATSLLGSLVLGDAPAARTTWSRYGGSLAEDPDLLLRQLSTRALLSGSPRP
jgi:spermidine synthase